MGQKKFTQSNHIPDRSYYVLLVLFVFSAFFFLKPALFNPDGIGYYSYLRSLVIDGDFSLFNEFSHYQTSKYFFHLTSEGHVRNVFAFGSALVWAPFFLIAHVLTLGLNLFGFHIPPDGYSFLYIFMTNFGTCFYGFLALILAYEVAKDYVSRRAACVSVLAIWFATNFWNYMFFDGTFSHIPSAFSVSLFIYIWHKTRHGRTSFQWILLGAAGGLMSMIRWQNVLYVIIPILEALSAFLRSSIHEKAVKPNDARWRGIIGPIELRVHSKFFGGSGREELRRIPFFVKRTLFFLSAFLFACLPQMIVWKVLYGSFITIPQGKWFLEAHDAAINAVLFSSHHGLFAWSPVLILATLGFYFLYRRDRFLSLALLVAFCLQVYINSKALDTYAGVSFGHRRFINCLPLFVFGLAALFDRLKPLPQYLITSLFVFWNYLLFLQFHFGLIEPHWYVSFSQIFQGQVGVFGRFFELSPLVVRDTMLDQLKYLGAFRWFVLFVVLLISCFTLFFMKRLSSWFRGQHTRHLRVSTVFFFLVLISANVLVLLGGMNTSPAPVNYKMQDNFAMVDFGWYVNSKYHRDPFRSDWTEGVMNHFPDLKADTIVWNSVPFRILPPFRNPEDRGSTITTAYRPDFRIDVPLKKFPTQAIWLAIDGGLMLGLKVACTDIVVHYADGSVTTKEVFSSVDVWDYRELPPEENVLWQGDGAQSLTPLQIVTESDKIPERIEFMSVTNVGNENKNAGIAVFAITQVLTDGTFETLDFKELSNSDYRQDPFKPEIVQNHFADLEGGMMKWQGVPFSILSESDFPWRGTTITTAYMSDYRIKIPLKRVPTRSLWLAVDGAAVVGLIMHCADIVLHYTDGTSVKKEVVSGIDVWDYWEDPPKSKLIWKGDGRQSLTVLEIETDARKMPAYLEIRSVRGVGNNFQNPGIAVFAITQGLE
ncbi:MAG: hypothetical protein JSV84_11550 [Gemmatimonadota bacterium]|nr:MAG: hypothetical protein JSV84_11550 [Gemmatimonadota bacterium]